MDTGSQPGGLPFGHKSPLNPKLTTRSASGQVPIWTDQQPDSYPLQNLQQRTLYTPRAQLLNQQQPSPEDHWQTPYHSGAYIAPFSPRLNPRSRELIKEQEQRLADDMPTSISHQSQHQHQQNQSAQPSRSNTWIPTSNGSSSSLHQVHLHRSIDTHGYPFDKETLPPRQDNPFSSSSFTHPSPTETPRDSIDIEKHKHVQWDKHTKLPGKRDPNQPYLTYSQRVKHFTWANYTLTMATGGIATLISIQPHAFSGLIVVGAIFYMLNLLFFTVITLTMLLRFVKYSGTFKASITHEREGLFLGPFFLSIATIITGTQKYVVESYEMDHPNRGWAVTMMAVAFWAYTFATFCLASFQYSYLFCSHTYKLNSFMPSWLLPIFPIMLAGTIASVIAKDQPVTTRMSILVAGLGCQGLGFTVAILMYAHYIGRLMQVGYPDREHRGAMFIAVGPPSFTCLALIGMANALPEDFDLRMDGLVDSKVLRTMALVVALFLWVLAMWFFMITLVAVLNSWAVYFHLGWWAMVFPNTGFVIATISIGNSMGNETILYIGNGLSVAIVTMWLFVLFNHIRAILVGDIIYPGLDEDIADH